MTLTGRRIALAEGRQLEDLAQLLEKEGALAVRAPLLAILDPPDDGPVLAWLDDLIAKRFHWVILFTGEGVRRMLTCAERHDRRDAFVAALKDTPTLTRGPKPAKALQELGFKPTRAAPAPTTDGVIAALGDIAIEGLTIGVQLYKEDNVPLTEYLASRGAHVRAVLPYVYAPASDEGRVVDLIDELARGDIDALVFTSSPQIDRLFEVADAKGLTDRLAKGFRHTRVAAVGPIVAENLERRQVRVDICPEQGWVMKNLVSHIKRAFAEST